MTNEEKAKELSKIFARQYHHNTYTEYSNNSEFVFSNEEIENAVMAMAEWKDREIAMLLLNINDMIADCKGNECITFISDYLKIICGKYCKEKVKNEKQGEKKETFCEKCRREQPYHSCQDITELGRCALEYQNKK